MRCDFSNVRRSVPWSPPLIGVLKLNVDGTSRGKPGPAGKGEVLRSYKSEGLIMFSKHIGVRDSNETKVLATLEALYLFSSDYSEALIVESDSSNAVAWANRKTFSWKF